MELPLARRIQPLACQTRQLRIRQGFHRHRFVERAVVPLKEWVQGQFHDRPGSGVAAERIHHIHQRVGPFTVVKVLVHFVPELRELFGFHKLQFYAVPSLYANFVKSPIVERTRITGVETRGLIESRKLSFVNTTLSFSLVAFTSGAQINSP